MTRLRVAFVALIFLSEISSNAKAGEAHYMQTNELHEYFGDSLVFAKTQKDGDPWRARFLPDGTVTFKYNNGSKKSGSWRIQDNSVQISFDGTWICRKIFIDDEGVFHWQTCHDLKTSSYILKFEFFNRNNEETSKQIGRQVAKTAWDILGGLTERTPADNPVGTFLRESRSLLAPQLMRILSPEDTRFFEEKIQTSLRNNMDGAVTSPSSGIQGRIQTLRKYTDTSGRECKTYETTIKGEVAVRDACVDETGNYQPI
jgi:hypothetical protein